MAKRQRYRTMSAAVSKDADAVGREQVGGNGERQARRGLFRKPNSAAAFG